MTALLAVLLVVQAESAPADAGAPAETKPPVRVYTNDDLDRVHPYRHQTGVASEPAFAPAPPGRSRSRPDRAPRASGEEYWRKEAARVRERVAKLSAEADELRATLAENEARRREEPTGRGRSAASSDLRVKARIAGLERRIRLLEDELQDRARRQGALPGWLR